MNKLTSAATDWIIGVFIVAALLLLVRPGSPAVLLVNLATTLIADLVGTAGGGPGTNKVTSPFQ